MNDAQFSAVDELFDGLHVRTKAVMHSNQDGPVGTLLGDDEVLHAGNRHPEGTFTENVRTSGQGRLDVRFVQMVGGTHDHGVRAGVCEEVLDVVVRFRDLQPRCQRARLRKVVVADGHDVELVRAAERLQMGNLCDRARADHPYSDGTAHQLRPPGNLYNTPARTDANRSSLERPPRISVMT